MWGLIDDNPTLNIKITLCGHFSLAFKERLRRQVLSFLPEAHNRHYVVSKRLTRHKMRKLSI